MSGLDEIWLVRHGATEWTATHQHTGRTDLPLTDAGRREAAALYKPLDRQAFAAAFTSPLRPGARDRPHRRVRRRRGARRPARVGLRRLRGPDHRGDPRGDPGLERVVATRSSTASRSPTSRPAPAGCSTGSRRLDGRVVLFAHAHVLRILTACALGLEPATGRALGLDAALDQRPRPRARLPRHPPLELDALTHRPSLSVDLRRAGQRTRTGSEPTGGSACCSSIMSAITASMNAAASADGPPATPP